MYHNNTYDGSFGYACSLAWNWVNAKWSPPSFISEALDFDFSSSAELKWAATAFVPKRFRLHNEVMSYIDNCRGYLLYTMPVSILTFLILNKIYHRFRAYRLSSVLISFSSWAYLLLSLIVDNAQYLSFRGFQQLRALALSNSIAIFSLTVSSLGLFTSLFCSIAVLPLSHMFALKIFRPPTLLKFFPSYKYLSLWSGIRFFSGLIHALIDDALLRITLILILQFVLAISALVASPHARYKSAQATLVVGLVMRLVLYVTIFFEVLYSEKLRTVITILAISGVSFILVAVVFIFNSLQILLNVAVGFMAQAKDSLDFQPSNGDREETCKSK